MQNPLRKWFVYWHGEGEAYQADLYRCQNCWKIVTFNQVRQGGCPCSHGKLCPTNPTFAESFKLILLPWMQK